MLKFVSLKKVRRGSYDMDLDDQAVCHEGYLERKTGVMKTYRKLWFQLCVRELKYYKTNPQWEPSEPKGKLTIADIQTVKVMSTQNRHLIQIITQKGTICLSGENVACCEEWVTHIRKAMQRARQSLTAPVAPPPQKGRSVRRPTMSTVSEEEEKRASSANAGLEYDLLDTGPPPTPKSPSPNDDFLYEEVQPVKRQTPSTVESGQTRPDSAVDDRGATDTAQSDSSSSIDDSTEAEQDVETGSSNLGYDVDIPRLPYPPLTEDDSASINRLRKLLLEMGVNPNEEGDLYENTTSGGMQELKNFIRSTFFVSF